MTEYRAGAEEAAVAVKVGPEGLDRMAAALNEANVGGGLVRLLAKAHRGGFAVVCVVTPTVFSPVLPEELEGLEELGPEDDER